MQRYALLTAALAAAHGDAGAKEAKALQLLEQYLQRANQDDAACAVQLLAGWSPPRLASMARLRGWVCQAAGIDDWLFEASAQAVGDMAETLALLWPSAAEVQAPAPRLASWLGERLLPLQGLPEHAWARQLPELLEGLDAPGRYLALKLISGSLAPAVRRPTLVRAVAHVAGLPVALVAQRLDAWGSLGPVPGAEHWQALTQPGGMSEAVAGFAWPFARATGSAQTGLAGFAGAELVVLRHAGLRVQVGKRQGQVWVWSEDEDLLTARCPELVQATRSWPEGTVLEGELLVWLPSAPRPEGQQTLQERLGRAQPTARTLANSPLVFEAFDVLEWAGTDLRQRAALERQQALHQVLQAPGEAAQTPVMRAAKSLPTAWDAALAQVECREQGAAGWRVWQRAADEQGTGHWLIVAAQPLRALAVLVYVQAPSAGRQAPAAPEYSVALWSRRPLDAHEAQTAALALGSRQPAQPGALQLVTFAKTSTCSNEADAATLAGVVKATSLHKFGPVMALRPTLVVEITFDELVPSPRHKSGLKVGGARIVGLRPDLALWQAQDLVDAGWCQAAQTSGLRSPRNKQA